MKTNDKVARPVESVSGQMSTQVTNTSSIGNSIKMNAKPETAVQSKRKSSISSIGNDAKHLESSAAGQGRSANEGATGDEPHNERQQKLQEQKSRRESKAANTLVLITICVIVCWLPFYSMYTISSIFKLKFGSTSNFWFKMTIWLGYFNSLLNPLIYAITNPYYRDAFRRILF